MREVERSRRGLGVSTVTSFKCTADGAIFKQAHSGLSLMKLVSVTTPNVVLDLQRIPERAGGPEPSERYTDY